MSTGNLSSPGTLIHARGREWVVLPESTEELLIARHRSSKAQEQMHKTLSGIKGIGSMGEFERLEARVRKHLAARGIGRDWCAADRNGAVAV